MPETQWRIRSHTTVGFKGNECLQYFTGVSGSFSSFNYDTSITTAPTITQQQHLASQDYSICFRYKYMT